MLSPFELFVLTLFFVFVGLAAACDVSELRIPNILCLAIAALYPAYVVGTPQPVDWVGAVALAGVVLIVGIGLFCCGLIGGGDAKLFAAVALWAGPSALIDLLLTTTIAGALISLAMIAVRHHAISFVLARIGAARVASAMSDDKLPYGVAIAIGAYLSVGPRVFGAV